MAKKHRQDVIRPNPESVGCVSTVLRNVFSSHVLGGSFSSRLESYYSKLERGTAQTSDYRALLVELEKAQNLCSSPTGLLRNIAKSVNSHAHAIVQARHDSRETIGKDITSIKQSLALQTLRHNQAVFEEVYLSDRKIPQDFTAAFQNFVKSLGKRPNISGVVDAYSSFLQRYALDSSNLGEQTEQLLSVAKALCVEQLAELKSVASARSENIEAMNQGDPRLVSKEHYAEAVEIVQRYDAVLAQTSADEIQDNSVKQAISELKTEVARLKENIKTANRALRDLENIERYHINNQSHIVSLQKLVDGITLRPVQDGEEFAITELCHVMVERRLRGGYHITLTHKGNGLDFSYEAAVALQQACDPEGSSLTVRNGKAIITISDTRKIDHAVDKPEQAIVPRSRSNHPHHYLFEGVAASEIDKFMKVIDTITIDDKPFADALLSLRIYADRIGNTGVRPDRVSFGYFGGLNVSWQAANPQHNQAIESALLEAFGISNDRDNHIKNLGAAEQERGETKFHDTALKLSSAEVTKAASSTLSRDTSQKR